MLDKVPGDLVAEHNRQTKMIPHFFTEKATMKLSSAILLAVVCKWRGVREDGGCLHRQESRGVSQ